MGQYEIQVLDSWGASEIKYNSCGGIYCRWINQQPVGGTAPTVNASRPPGEWQSFDVIFRGPQFDESGKKTGNATFEQVIWNDEIVHKNVQVEGVTRGAMMDAESGSGPLMLQGDHGPVAYRNIRMRSLS